MKIIALYSPKGGVGKSVTSVNLSYLLSADGKKTLLWDFDPQGASSFYFQVEQELSKKIEDIFTEKKSLRKSITKTQYANLFVLPSDFSFRNLDLIIDAMKKPIKKLKNTISEVNDYDFLIIDSPPGFTNLNKLISKISDTILVPVIPTYLSLRTLDKLKFFMDSIGVNNEKIFPFFSMADRRKKLHRQIIEEKIGEFEIKTVIPYSAEIEKMGETLLPVPLFSKNKRLIEIYHNLKQEIIDNA